MVFLEEKTFVLWQDLTLSLQKFIKATSFEQETASGCAIVTILIITKYNSLNQKPIFRSKNNTFKEKNLDTFDTFLITYLATGVHFSESRPS